MATSFFTEGNRNNISISDNTVTVRNIQQQQFGTFSCQVKFDSQTKVVTYKVLKLSGKHTDEVN